MKESKYSNRNNHGIFHVRCMFHFIENMFNSKAIYREFQLLKDQLKATKGKCPLFILCRGDFDKRIYGTLGDGSGNKSGEREAN